MRVEGPIPFHIARAYGVQSALHARRAASATAIGGAPSAPSASPLSATRPAAPPLPASGLRPSEVGELTRAAGISRPRHIDRLVGATVDQPISFDGAATVSPGAASLPMYTRAADKIEAAVAVNVGRAIDVTG